MNLLRLVGALALVSVTACSQQQSGESLESSDTVATPDVSPTAAPGVAWRYAYEFQLPDEAISSVQEAHASRCEALGVIRCRITGLRYSVGSEDSVSAMLEVKLAPGVARQFGKQATAIVTNANGRLSNTEFTGTDTAVEMSQATRTQSELPRRIADIRDQLRSRSLRDSERAQLQAQLSELETQMAGAQSSIGEVREKLASTPMTFNYHGKGGISGFAGRNPVMDALRSFVSSMVTMITILLQLLAWLLPWALLLFLIFLAARSRPGRAVRRFFSRRDEGVEHS